MEKKLVKIKVLCENKTGAFPFEFIASNERHEADIIIAAEELKEYVLNHSLQGMPNAITKALGVLAAQANEIIYKHVGEHVDYWFFDECKDVV